MPLSMMDNRRSVLPALTSVIKSEEFYDRYDFLIDYVKKKNPSSMETQTIKAEQTTDQATQMEVSEDSSTQAPAYSIISNALGVTAMSTLVTK
jgi:methionine-rich copper-binding protein CopC